MGQTTTQRAWTYAGVILALLAGFIAVMTTSPDLFAHQLFGKTYLTVGVLLGIGVIVIPVIFTAMYNAIRRGDQSDG